METYLFILIAIIIAAIIGYRIYQKNKKTVRLAPSEKTTQTPILMDKLPGMWTDFKVSPGGVKNYSVVILPEKVLEVVQAAAELRIKVIGRLFPNWTRGLTLSEYEIWFLKSDGIAPEARVPFLLIGGVMSAGTIGQGTRPVVILPEHTAIDWNNSDYLFWSAYNEMEHFTEYLNEPNGRFLQFGGDDDVHQHDQIPADLQPRSLVSVRKPVSLPCGFNDTIQSN